MSLRTWNNGEKGEVIKAILESNFKMLGRYLSRNILALSTEERNSLSSDYLGEGLVVFDTTLKKWVQYSNGIWGELPYQSVYCLNISQSSWSDGTIYIPYSQHTIPNPQVQLYILNNNIYEAVIGGVSVDSENNITLSTDMAFNGRVVIK